MASNQMDMDMVDTLRANVTVKVTVHRATEARWRTWLGFHLLNFAAWVMPSTVDIEVSG